MLNVIAITNAVKVQAYRPMLPRSRAAAGMAVSTA